MTKLHRAAIAALLIALVGACSGGEDAAARPAAVTNAAEKTLAAGTARVVASVRTSGQPLSIEMDGVYDFERKRGDFSFDIDAAAMSGQTDGIADGATLYLDVGEEAIPGKRWVRVNAAETTPAGVGSVAAPTLQASPTTSLRYLDGAESVEKVGTEIVRQIRTTHYRMRIDVKRAAEANEDDVGDALDQIGDLELDAEAWIDDQGRLRRFEFTIPVGELPGATDAARGRLTITQDLFEFGADVDVELPPADQIAELSDLPPPPGPPPA